MNVLIVLLSTAMLLVVSIASADEFPARKPGLWEVVTTTGGTNAPPNKSKLCIDKATEEALQAFGTAATSKMCSKSQVRVSGKVVTVESTCQIGTSQQTSRSTLTFSGDTAYHTQINAHFDPPFLGKTDSVTTQDAKWSGPCPADMRPGDIVTATGMRMNIRDMPGEKR